MDSHWALLRLKYHRPVTTPGIRQWGKLCRHSMVDDLTASAHQGQEGATEPGTSSISQQSFCGLSFKHPNPGGAQQLC